MRRIPALLVLGLTAAAWACGENGPALQGSTAEAAGVRADAASRPGDRITAGYTLGAADAPVAVVEFSDFGCPYCGRFANTTFPELRTEYVEAGLVRWRYVPVSFGFAGGAVMGAAAECAGRLAGGDGFWQAHDILYRHQAALRGDEALPRLLEWLGEAGLDRERIEACVRDPSTRDILQGNNLVAEEWFVRGTPTFLVNGVPMSGALPTEFFRKVLNTALDPSGL